MTDSDSIRDGETFTLTVGDEYTPLECDCECTEFHYTGERCLCGCDHQRVFRCNSCDHPYAGTPRKVEPS